MVRKERIITGPAHFGFRIPTPLVIPMATFQRTLKTIFGTADAFFSNSLTQGLGLVNGGYQQYHTILSYAEISISEVRGLWQFIGNYKKREERLKLRSYSFECKAWIKNHEPFDAIRNQRICIKILYPRPAKRIQLGSLTHNQSQTQLLQERRKQDLTNGTMTTTNNTMNSRHTYNQKFGRESNGQRNHSQNNGTQSDTNAKASLMSSFLKTNDGKTGTTRWVNYSWWVWR